MPHKLLRTAVAVSSAGALCLACGNDGAPRVTATSTSTALDFCDELASVQYATLANCLGASADVLASWRASSERLCQALAKEIAAGRVGYDAGKAQACSAALPQLGCTAFAGAQASASLGQVDARALGGGVLDEPACAGSLAGTIAAGGTCYDDLECAEGVCTSSDTLSCPGTCVPAAREGQSCIDSPCGPELACDVVDPANAICKRPSPSSGPCPCADGLYCDTSGSTPTCLPLKTSGPCVFSSECAAALVCAGSPSTCQPYAPVGSPCVFAASGCAPGLVCDAATSTCELAPSTGEPCVQVQGTATLVLLCRDSYCDAANAQTCQSMKADGSPCHGDEECKGFCDATARLCVGDEGLICDPP